MSRTSRNHGSAFKAKVALKGEQTVAAIAAKHGLHPTLVNEWKRQLAGCQRRMKFGSSAFPVELDAKSRWDAHIRGPNPSTFCIALDHHTPAVPVAGRARRRPCRGQFRARHRACPILRSDRLLSDMRHAVGTGSRPLHPPCRRPSHDGPHRLPVPSDPPLPLLAIGLPAPDLRRAPACGGALPETAHRPARRGPALPGAGCGR